MEEGREGGREGGRREGGRQGVMTVVHILIGMFNRHLSRHLYRCDRVILDEVGDSNGGNVLNVTMRITFVTRKFGNVERNSH